MSLSPDNKRRETYKTELSELLNTNPEAGLVEQRYKVMNFLLHKEWGNTLSVIKRKKLEVILRDVVYIDRLIRLKTEGVDEENKLILSQQFQLEELSKM